MRGFLLHWRIRGNDELRAMYKAYDRMVLRRANLAILATILSIALLLAAGNCQAISEIDFNAASNNIHPARQAG